MAHGGGDVMEFQIKKDLAAGVHECAHEDRAFGSEELQSNFVDSGGIANAANQIPGRAGVGHVQSHNEAIAHACGVLSEFGFESFGGHRPPSIVLPELVRSGSLVGRNGSRLHQVKPYLFNATIEVEHSGG